MSETSPLRPRHAGLLERGALEELVRALIEEAWQRARRRRRRRVVAVGIALGIAASVYLGVSQVVSNSARASAAVQPFSLSGPAGKREQIVFAAFNRLGGRSVYRIFADGSGLKPLTNGREILWSPVLSPNARRIEFTVQGRRRRSIVVMNDHGGQRREVVVNGEFATWSPDGRMLAFDRAWTSHRASGGIYVVSASGGRPRRLTSGRFAALPDWSPDGSRIAYADGHGGVRVMNADGSHDHLLARHVGVIAPVWSPDSSKIAFRSAGRMYVVNADGTALRMLAPHFAWKTSDCPVAWSPDGRRLLFTPYHWRLWVMNLDGSHLAPLKGLPLKFGACGASWRRIARAP